MELAVRNVILSFLFIFFINLNGFGQACTGTSQCASGSICCGGNCVQARTCAPGNPPPPGLVVPIDSNISYLLISGIGLGIYFLIANRKKEAA